MKDWDEARPIWLHGFCQQPGRVWAYLAASGLSWVFALSAPPFSWLSQPLFLFLPLFPSFPFLPLPLPRFLAPPSPQGTPLTFSGVGTTFGQPPERGQNFRVPRRGQHSGMPRWLSGAQRPATWVPWFPARLWWRSFASSLAPAESQLPHNSQPKDSQAEQPRHQVSPSAAGVPLHLLQICWGIP